MMHILGFLAAAAVLWPSVPEAHQLVGFEVGCSAQMTVSDSGLTGDYSVHLGEIVAFNERKQMDLDGDGTLSASEQRAYLDLMARKLPANLSLVLDAQHIKPVLDNGTMALSTDQFVDAEPIELVYRIAPIVCSADSLGRSVLTLGGRRRVAFKDENYVKNKRLSLVSLETTADLSILEKFDWKQKRFRNLAATSIREQAAINVVVGPASEADKMLASSENDADQTGGNASGPTGSGAGLQRLKQILKTGQLSLKFVLLALVIATFLGAVHALEPGHGKTIVAAYLIGSRGTVLNAVFLGCVVTLTHTLSVILLGVITLFASQYILPEKIFPWLGFVSGLAIVAVGIWMLVRSRSPHGHGHSHGRWGGHDHDDDESEDHDHDPDGDGHGEEGDHHHHESHGHDHDHDEGHDHDHGQGHHHDQEHGEGHHDDRHHHRTLEHTPARDHQLSARNARDPEAHEHLHPHHHPHPQQPEGSSRDAQVSGRAPVSWGSLLSLGISGGLVPCPGALVILLTAVGLHRILFGLVLISAFSVGLAAVLVTIGILMVTARSTFSRFTGEGKVVRLLPRLSAIVITILGIVLAIQALVGGGVITVNV